MAFFRKWLSCQTLHKPNFPPSQKLFLFGCMSKSKPSMYEKTTLYNKRSNSSIQKKRDFITLYVKINCSFEELRKKNEIGSLVLISSHGNGKERAGKDIYIFSKN